MAVTPLPVEIELVIYAGTNLERVFRWLPDGTNPQDFTGWTAVMLLGPRGNEAIFELSTTNGAVVLGANGSITIALDATETQALRGISGLYWQLDLHTPGGFIQRFARGRVSVVRDVDPISP